MRRIEGEVLWLPYIILFHLFFSCVQSPSGSSQNEFSSKEYLALLLDTTNETQADLFAPATVRAFYEIYDGQLVWSNGENPTPRANEMRRRISLALYDGLIPKELHQDEIAACNPDSLNPLDAARLDVLLTDAYFKYAWQLEHGRLKPSTTRQYILEEDEPALVVSLFHALNNDGIESRLASHEPSNIIYRQLKGDLHNQLEPGAGNHDDFINTLVNIERSRWEKREFPKHFILVNIPSFELYVYKNDSLTFQSRIIVGTPEHPTPLLESKIECVLIYPYWHVPYSIASKELLPQFQRDPSRVDQQHFEVFDRRGNKVNPNTIRWKDYTEQNFPFSIRQKEGSANSLGILKFNFDNPYAVYLHDTNARYLFNKTNRALSHGCVRVERAKDLAMYLVKDDATSNRGKKIQHWIATRTRKEVNVDPMPLFIRYYTRDHGMSYADVYGHNDGITREISNALMDTAAQPYRHVAMEK